VSIKNCACCWNEKNPDENSVECEASWILQEFKVCKKHKEELMAILCSGCGKPTSPRTVPKGPRGPWVANECLNGCMTPDGKYKLTTKGSAQQTQPQPQNATKTGIVGVGIERKIDQILAILKENFPPLQQEEVSEDTQTPF
jgi:hypothetical protein